MAHRHALTTIIGLFLLFLGEVSAFHIRYPLRRTIIHHTPRRLSSHLRMELNNMIEQYSAVDVLGTTVNNNVDISLIISTTSSVKNNLPGLLVSVDTVSFLKNSDTWVFLAGCFPFVWATVEFWRRIAVGEPFGTGSDSVVIGEDNNPESSRGRRVLGKDALIVAYLLFGISAAVVGLVLYTVLTNDPLPTYLPAVTEDVAHT